MSEQATLMRPQSVEPLFDPVTLGSLQLRNRLVMAPMTRAFSPGGVPGPDVAAYYAKRAAGGVGLIVTEGTFVPHPSASNNDNIPNFYGPSALHGWNEVRTVVQAAGARIMPQLWHVGLLPKRVVANIPQTAGASRYVSPSGFVSAQDQTDEPMSLAEIEAVITAFGDAAASAQRLGFDGVEIHGAHGYLIDQFLWEGTNRRTDAFGGNLAARSRFAAEIVRECRTRTSAEFPIVFRFSQWKQQDYTARLANTPAELETVLTPLVEAGVDIFHCSQRRYWQSEFEGSDMSLSGWTKQITGRPAIIVGSVGLDRDMSAAGFAPDARAGAAGLDPLLRMFHAGEFDLAAVGRAIIGNPDWCDIVRRGEWTKAIAYSAEFLGAL